MTEKEKMLASQIYNANDDTELLMARIRTKDLCYEYNNLKPSQKEERNKTMRKILGKVKKNFWIEQPFWCDYGCHIEIGENFYSNHNLVLLDANKIIIGDNVFIGPNCGLYTAGHPLDSKQRREGLEYAKPIKIGNNVWIGGNVVILPGVTIGNNCVIGAGSVVTKDIADSVVAVGNPCRVIKSIDETILIKE